jgi:hypothetical protein
VRSLLSFGIVVLALTVAACSGGVNNPIAPTGTDGGTTAIRPSQVCRGGSGGFPCWAPGSPPPTGPTPPAAVLTYDEAVSGDLPDTRPFRLVGSVGAGDNTVAGTTSAQSDGTSFTIDIDSFAFEVPAGLAVTRVVFEWDLVATGSVTDATTSFDLQVDEDSLQFMTVNLLQGIPPFTEVTAASGSEEPFAAALPIGAGAYDVVNSLFGLGGFGSGSRSWTASYRWTITAQ